MKMFPAIDHSYKLIPELQISFALPIQKNYIYSSFLNFLVINIPNE